MQRQIKNYSETAQCLKTYYDCEYRVPCKQAYYDCIFRPLSNNSNFTMTPTTSTTSNPYHNLISNTFLTYFLVFGAGVVVGLMISLIIFSIITVIRHKRGRRRNLLEREQERIALARINRDLADILERNDLTIHARQEIQTNRDTSFVQQFFGTIREVFHI